ncbi:MAG TPA: hypothetical protein VKB95_11200 [Chitinophagaceae bacterium]|nr:hypothetical protein [Chitinophagaceae bacterium]
MMKLFLLDAGGAGLYFAALVVFTIIAVSAEAIVMLLMKYNKAGKAFLDSFLVNLGSLVAGYLLLAITGTVFNLTTSAALNILILYVLTVAVESLLLYLLNRGYPVKKTVLVCIVMNLLTYLILYLF